MASPSGLVGTTLLAAGLTLIGLVPSRTAGDALAPEAVRPLEAAAKELAASGRRAELSDLLEILRRAGMEAGELGKLSAACERDLAKVKNPAATVPSVAKSLQRIAADLAAHLADKGEPERGELARLLVRLDDSNEAAQRLLGREKTGDEWLDERSRKLRARRGAVERAVEQARALDVKLEVVASSNATLARSENKQRSLVRVGPFEVHGVWPAEKLTRVVRQTMRGLALANFLLTDELKLPDLPALRVVCFDLPTEFHAAIDRARQAGKIDAALLPILDRFDALTVDGEVVACKILEADAEAELLSRAIEAVNWKRKEALSMSSVQPGFRAGLTNWCCLELLGTRMPVYATSEEKSQAARGGGTAGSTREQQELRERLFLLSDAGICGGRAWLQFLAERREDPPLVDVFADQLGRIQGDKLLKATFVLEMLAQRDPVFDVARKLRITATGGELLPVLETALGEPVGKFEAEWREWIAPAKAGLVQRLGAPAAKKGVSDEERNTLDALNLLRRDAGLGAIVVDLDHATSEACRKHVRYLLANPEQMSRWPDVHEEYPDHPAFDTAGAWAASHSVIATGVKDGRDALAGWMATLYHRLPLIDPGLVRIGYASEGGCAVLDSGSFVKPREGPLAENHPAASRRSDPSYWAVIWPPANGVSIPTHYAQEQPQPIPGEDPSKLGYPVTFQLRAKYAGPRVVTLELHTGDAKGPVVACWCSTPTNPTNPMLAPDDTWCLIPKQPLHAGAYTVTGTLHLEISDVVDESFKWSFHCDK